MASSPGSSKSIGSNDPGMKIPLRYWTIALLCLLGIALRSWQVNSAFQEARERIPDALQGSWEAWVSEEPQVLFQHRPESHDTGRGSDSYGPWVREIRMVCTVISLGGQPFLPAKVRCVLRLSSGSPSPILSYGDEIFFQGKVQEPPVAMNPGQFDYARFLRNKGVAYVAYLEPGRWGKAPSSHPWGWAFARGSYRLKRWAQDHFYRFLPYPENALMDGILLGERSALPEDLVDSFFLTGTIHILAVSGLMTAFVAGALFLVLRVLGFPRKWAAGLALGGLAAFVCMTGADPPVFRSGLFSGLVLWGILLEKRVHGGALLAMTVVLLTIQNPLIPFDLSFQISFLATTGLMVGAARISQKLSFLGPSAATLVATSFAAQCSVFCILAYAFNQISPYSLPANLVIVPLALFATAAGLAFLGGAFLHPFLGDLLSQPCEASLRILEWLAGGIAKWPGAQTLVASPPAFWTISFHLLLILSFLALWPLREPVRPGGDWIRKKGWFRRARSWVMVAWCLFLGGSAVLFLVHKSRPQPLRVLFLSVGHGNAVVLESPKGRFRVVDGGKESKGSDRYNPVVSALRHVGVGAVEAILSTHPDEDHLGGLLNLVRACRVSEAFEGEGVSADTSVYKRFHELIQREAVPLFPVKAGSPLPDWDGVRWEILHPAAGFHPKVHPDNNSSVVSRISFGSFTLILPGDLEREGLLRLLKDQGATRRVDWWMAPHHGRQSGEPLLCALGFQPRFVLFSDSKEYPRTRIQYQEGAPGVTLLATPREGAVEVEFYADGHGRFRGFREGTWRYFTAKGV